jgi:hypothetical protein
MDRRTDLTRKRIFCIGTAKSGTHSIHSIFAGVARSAHEPENTELIRQIIDHHNRLVSDSELREFVKKRCIRLNLDVDSSQLNFFILKFLLEEFVEAFFILTIRDCYTWLDSFINFSLTYPSAEKWALLRDIRFGKRVDHFPPEEKVLNANGLYSLEGYLKYWTYHNEQAISKIPQNKLLIIRTDRISNSIEELARFTGYRLKDISSDQKHAFKNPQKFNILKKIDPDYLEEKIKKYCSNLMEQYFPEIKSMKDVL